MKTLKRIIRFVVPLVPAIIATSLLLTGAGYLLPATLVLWLMGMTGPNTLALSKT